MAALPRLTRNAVLLAVDALSDASRLVVDRASRPILVSERPMRGDRVPRVYRELACHAVALGGIELLPRDAQSRDGDLRRGPDDRRILDRHQHRVLLEL